MIFLAKKRITASPPPPPPVAETVNVAGTQAIGGFMPNAIVDRLEIVYRGLTIPATSEFDYFFSYTVAATGQYTHANIRSFIEGAFDGLDFLRNGAGATLYPNLPVGTPFDIRFVWDVAGDGSNRYRFVETDTTGAGSFSDESGFGVNTTPVTAENPSGLILFFPQETSNNFVGSFEGIEVIADGVTRLNLDPATVALANSGTDLNGNSFTVTGTFT